MSGRRAALLVLLTATLAGAGPAQATDVSTERLGELAAEAGSDPAALEELRAVTTVEGRPADVDRALAAEGDELEARLAELASSVDPDAGGLPVGEIVQPDRPPPDEPEEAGDGGGDTGVFGLGVSTPVAIAIALVTVLLVAFLSSRVASRRLPAEGGRAPGEQDADPSAPATAGELEREADRAAQRGDHAAAVQLRFRAGLLRLERARAIELRPSLTPRAVARRVRSERLDGLTLTFERVTYGDGGAAAGDTETARRDWPAVVEEAKRR